MPPANDFFRALAREALKGAIGIGNRAATSAVKSMAKDSRRFVAGIEKKAREVEARCDTFIDAVEEEDDPLDDPPRRTRARTRE